MKKNIFDFSIQIKMQTKIFRHQRRNQHKFGIKEYRNFHSLPNNLKE